MFASPMWRIKRARSFAKFFDAELAVCDKYRKEANRIDSMRLIGEVEGWMLCWSMT
jgi:ribose-phosphate pyrophosphokinase